MSEISEMMLDGTLCEGCGVHLKGRAAGLPRRCSDCKKDLAEENVQANKEMHAAAKKHKCPVCGKKLRMVGMADHQRDAHGIAKTLESTA